MTLNVESKNLIENLSKEDKVLLKQLDIYQQPHASAFLDIIGEPTLFYEVSSDETIKQNETNVSVHKNLLFVCSCGLNKYFAGSSKKTLPIYTCLCGNTRFKQKRLSMIKKVKRLELVSLNVHTRKEEDLLAKGYGNHYYEMMVKEIMVELRIDNCKLVLNKADAFAASSPKPFYFTLLKGSSLTTKTNLGHYAITNSSEVIYAETNKDGFIINTGKNNEPVAKQVSATYLNLCYEAIEKYGLNEDKTFIDLSEYQLKQQLISYAFTLKHVCPELASLAIEAGHFLNSYKPRVYSIFETDNPTLAIESIESYMSQESMSYNDVYAQRYLLILEALQLKYVQNKKMKITLKDLELPISTIKAILSTPSSFVYSYQNGLLDFIGDLLLIKANVKFAYIKQSSLNCKKFMSDFKTYYNKVVLHLHEVSKKQYFKRKEEMFNYLYILLEMETINFDSFYNKIEKTILSKNMDLLTIYLDYIKMSKEHGLSYKAFPRTVEKHHDIRQKEVRLLLKNKNNNELDGLIQEKYTRHFTKTVKGFAIYQPTKLMDLIKEGDVLNHCVAGYAERVIEGQSLVYFLRSTNEPNQPFVTLEIIGNTIIQAAMKYNQSLTTDVKQILKEIAEAENLVLSI